MIRSGLSRPWSALKGAFRVDTTGKSIDEVVEIMKGRVLSALGK